jgi:hypothetical protein
MTMLGRAGRSLRYGVQPMDFENDPHAGDDNPELLDRIDAPRVRRDTSTEEKGRLLEEIGGPGKVEQEIVSQLSKIKPLWQPAQFPEAHRMAMRSLEVLDRNGVRGAPMPKVLGPLKPIVGFIVQLVTRLSWVAIYAASRSLIHLRPRRLGPVGVGDTGSSACRLGIPVT